MASDSWRRALINKCKVGTVYHILLSLDAQTPLRLLVRRSCQICKAEVNAIGFSLCASSQAREYPLIFLCLGVIGLLLCIVRSIVSALVNRYTRTEPAIDRIEAIITCLPLCFQFLTSNFLEHCE